MEGKIESKGRERVCMGVGVDLFSNSAIKREREFRIKSTANLLIYFCYCVLEKLTSHKKAMLLCMFSYLVCPIWPAL